MKTPLKHPLKLHPNLITIACATVLTLSACNPLGGDLNQSKFDESHQPGLPTQNVAPVASGSSLSVLKNIVKPGTLTGSDADSGDTLSFAIVSQGTKGIATVTDAATGAFTYTPNNNVIGSDSFTFKISDGLLNSNTATVSVTIYDPNIAPVASAISPAAFNEDTQSGVITLSYVDADSDLATACTITNPSNVTVTQACACNGSGVCTLKTTGTSHYFGAASFDYTVTTNGQDSNVATATLSITSVNDIPVASSGTLTTSEDTNGTGTLAATDVESSPLTYSVVANGAHGTVTITNASTGTYTYVPAANYNGADSFTFKANDGSADSNTATITVTVTAVNDAPVASAGTLTTNEDTTGTGTLVATDVEASALTYSIVSNGSHGTATVTNASTGAFSYVPVANYNGADSFTFKANDGTSNSNTATITVTVTSVEDAPTISSISNTSTNEDVAKAINFTINDVESTLNCGSSVAMTSTNTTLVPDANVVWSGTAPTCTGTVTPASNGYGTTDLTFTVSDGAAMTATRTFTLTVNQLGDESFDGSVAGDHWPFDALTTGLYSFASTVIQFSSGIAELIATVQTDSESTETTSGTYTAGAPSGVTYATLTDGINKGLKLGSGGGCDGASADCAKQSASEIYELNSSWAPRWANVVGYWKFDNSWDASVGAWTGTASGGATYASSKVGSQAGSFDGTDDLVSLSSNTTFGLSNGSYTVSVWFKTLGTTDNLMVSKGGILGDLGWAMGLGTTSGTLRVFLKDTFGGQASERSTASTYNDGNWHLFTAVITTSTTVAATNDIQIYVDGKLDQGAQTKSGDVYAPSTTSTFGVGARGIGSTPSLYFPGSLDELSVWNVALTQSQVQTIYDRQRTAYSGTFTSRIMDAKSSGSWTTLSWLPTLPFHKELPDYSGGAVQNESSTDYTSLVGSTGATGANDLMTGIVGLWHLDESSWADVANEVKDDSGQANHGRASGGAEAITNGVTLGAGRFDGVDDYISTKDIDMNFVTISAWVKSTASTFGSIVSKAYNGNFVPFLLNINNGPNEIAGMSIYSAGWWTTGINTIIMNDGKWHHVAGTYDGAVLKYYIDGVLDSSANYVSAALPPTDTIVEIGRYANRTQYFTGSIDEVAIWNRALHANEIKQLYQRGASRIKYQVRTCDDNACSGESWQGPDGSSGTYFSELNNNSTPLTSSGDVKATLPSMLLSSFTSPPANNQYFQYRTILESDSTTSALRPELKSTTVSPIHYPKYLSTDTSPLNTIIGQNGVSFYDLNDFTQSLGSGGCSNGVVYNLGLSNTGPWKYWTGSVWATANGSSAQANTAAALIASSNAALTAFATEVGRGSVFFKAFMTSSGTTKCELDNILVGGHR